MRFSSLLTKAYIFVLLGVILLALSFVPLYAFLPATFYWEARPTVANGEGLNQKIGFLIDGSYVLVDVYVYGGDNQITASIVDSSDNIVKQGLIENSGLFFFEPPRNEYYSLYLENGYSFSTENGKQILVKTYYYLYNILFLISGLIILIGGFVLAVFHFELKKVKG
jgi:hypothetical protein